MNERHKEWERGGGGKEVERGWGGGREGVGKKGGKRGWERGGGGGEGVGKRRGGGEEAERGWGGGKRSQSAHIGNEKNALCRHFQNCSLDGWQNHTLMCEATQTCLEYHVVW